MSQQPLTRQQIADLYFMEHRAKVLDIAAFLDRADKAGAGPGVGKDVRFTTLERALALLIDGKADRARRVLELMSDPTTAPIDKADVKGAIGVWPDAGTEKRR